MCVLGLLLRTVQLFSLHQSCRHGPSHYHCDAVQQHVFTRQLRLSMLTWRWLMSYFGVSKDLLMILDGLG